MGNKMYIDCPACGSNHTQRAALTHGTGKSYQHSHSTNVGIGMPLAVLHLLFNPLAYPYLLWEMLKMLARLIFIFVGFSFTRGTSETIVARDLEPPWHFSVPLACAFGVLSTGMSWGIAYLARHYLSHGHLFVLVTTPVALAATVLVLGTHYNEKLWKPREDLWQRTFMCRRCGTVFEVEDFDLPEGSSPLSYRHRRGKYLPRGEGVRGKRA